MSEVPSLRSDEAVEAILAAVKEEVDRTYAQVEEDLGKGLGSRALEGRVKVVADTLAKVERYGAILGRSVEDFTARLVPLQAQVMDAHMLAKSKAEKEKAAK